MKYSAPIVNIPIGKEGQFKFPTPAELFNYLTDEDASQYYKLNDANSDTDLYIVNLLQLLKQQTELFSWVNGDIQDLYTSKKY
jgi:hypothetical protein